MPSYKDIKKTNDQMIERLRKADIILEIEKPYPFSPARNNFFYCMCFLLGENTPAVSVHIEDGKYRPLTKKEIRRFFKLPVSSFDKHLLGLLIRGAVIEIKMKEHTEIWINPLFAYKGATAPEYMRDFFRARMIGIIEKEKRFVPPPFMTKLDELNLCSEDELRERAREAYNKGKQTTETQEPYQNHRNSRWNRLEEKDIEQLLKITNKTGG